MCVQGKYVSAIAAGIQNIREFLFCPNYLLSSENTGTTVIIKNGNVPFKNGGAVPPKTSFCWSDKSGLLKGFNGVTVGTITGSGAITITSATPKIL